MRFRHLSGLLLAGFIVAAGCSDSGEGDGDGGTGGGAADAGITGGGGGVGGANGGASGAAATAGGGASGAAATAGGGAAGAAAGAGTAGAAGTAATDGGAGAGGCFFKTCQGKTYDCGDCVDNDGDGLIDVGEDPDCLGPCHDAEDTFYGSIPGQAGPACDIDCYFDQDSGSGNDDCFWNHKCDPLSVAPNYPPENDPACECKDPSTDWQCTANISGTSQGCKGLYDQQTQECEDYCGPLTPNGCDCFGCCELPAESGQFVWLGSEDDAGNGICDLLSVNDPTKCRPCTPVAACLNTCLHCELCLGKTELPSDCFPPPPDGGVGGSSGTAGTSGGGGTSAGGTSGSTGTGGSSGSCGGQICPVGAQPCGLACQPPCPAGYYCNTGCCAFVP